MLFEERSRGVSDGFIGFLGNCRGIPEGFRSALGIFQGFQDHYIEFCGHSIMFQGV